MTQNKKIPQRRISDPDNRSIDLDKFCKKLERYVNGTFAFSDREKEETIEELFQLVVSCCSVPAEQRISDAIAELQQRKSNCDDVKKELPIDSESYGQLKIASKCFECAILILRGEQK
jgi:hypothetical protein